MCVEEIVEKSVFQFVQSLPSDTEDVERSRRFRVLVSESKTSERALKLARAVYEAIGDIERMLARFSSSEAPARRLWNYVLEVSEKETRRRA